MINRLAINVTGFVQGVGFRPFVYKIAQILQLTGWVYNDLNGVKIEVQGKQDSLEAFLIRLKSDLPSVAKIVTCDLTKIDSIADELDFVIKFNNTTSETTAIISPDLATCKDCLQEIFNAQDRRYLYPFTNCTQCGPRFSIVKALPYERYNTSMHSFTMCAECYAEYHDVACRRFHAQPNACWVCGPQIELIDPNNKVLASKQEVFLLVAEALRNGKIVAVKGLGGFHLFVDARNYQAIARLRTQKHRQNKPLAIMVPSLQYAQQLCELNVFEKDLLTCQQAPIVLLPRNKSTIIAENVAPNNPYLGIMLPYMPLHHILLQELNFPVVATSGNFSGEPICTTVADALDKLSNIADLLLIHNREIVNRIDDSVVRTIDDKKIFLRRARGYSPYYHKNASFTKTILAVGGNMKNTFALSQAGNILLSQHIGDLDNIDSLMAFKNGIHSVQAIYNFAPNTIACDMHPDYLSTKYAIATNKQYIAIQHHHAHIAAVMVEKQLSGPVLGISWDGSGYGLDNTVWGGEFLIVNYENFKRVGHLSLLGLPGGEKAIKEPNRIAVWMLTRLSNDIKTDFGHLKLIKKFKNSDLQLLLNMIASQLNTPMTSSIGRLFDGIAAILGLREQVDFEGQAAMELEFLAEQACTDENYAFDVATSEVNIVIKWESLLRQILGDLNNKQQLSIMARKFHNTMVDIIVYMAKKIAIKKVVLAGGCFQNKILLKQAIEKLTMNGFFVYWPEEVPINDAGIAIGQLAIANAKLDKEL